MQPNGKCLVCLPGSDPTEATRGGRQDHCCPLEVHVDLVFLSEIMQSTLRLDIFIWSSASKRVLDQSFGKSSPWILLDTLINFYSYIYFLGKAEKDLASCATIKLPIGVFSW